MNHDVLGPGNMLKMSVDLRFDKQQCVVTGVQREEMIEMKRSRIILDYLIWNSVALRRGSKILTDNQFRLK